MAAPGVFWYVAPFMQLRAVLHYSSGPQCVEFAQVSRERLALSAAEPLSPGKSVESTGYFIVGNFYTPTMPSGNHTKLGDVLIVASDFNYEVTPISGAVKAKDGGGTCRSTLLQTVAARCMATVGRR